MLSLTARTRGSLRATGLCTLPRRFFFVGAALFGAALFGLLLFTADEAPAQSPAPKSEAQSGANTSADTSKIRYFLTRTGLIQEGIPEDRGDTIFLRSPNDTGGLTITKLDILFVGLTRSEIFEYQLHQLPPGDIGSLLRLADWAARNQLSADAISYLKAAADATSDPVRQGALIEHIGKMEYVERIKAEALLRTAEAAGSDPSDTTPLTSSGLLPKQDSERARLAAFAKKIPFTVEDRYTRKVEPVLLNRCGTSDCHAEGSGSAFTLEDPRRKRDFHQVRLRNLESVLDFVTCGNPQNSPILHHPEIVGLNGERVWPFGEDEMSLSDYQVFTDWLQSLGGKMRNYTPDPNRPRESTRAARGTSSGGASEGTPATYIQTSGSGSPAELTANIDLAETRANRPAGPNDDAEALRRAGYIPTTQLRDEFDPAPFNQKYHPKGPPGGLQESPR